MKKKLKIDNLKVKSFVTEEERNTLKGGIQTNQRECYYSVVYCISIDFCFTEGVRCDSRYC